MKHESNPLDEMQMETKLIHAGEPRPFIEKERSRCRFFTVAPTSISGRKTGRSLATRDWSNTPNHLCLEEKLAALEGGEAALVTATGMAAISTAMLALVGEGQTRSCTGQSVRWEFSFFSGDLSFSRQEGSLFSLGDVGELKKQLRPETCAFTSSRSPATPL